MCEAGEEVSFCEEGTPAEGDATCDGLDDDCDGVADEDFVPGVVTCGEGACAAEGESLCVDGSVQEMCEAGQPSEETETCDAIDNDCDGLVDEDCDSTPPQCNEGFVVTQGDWTVPVAPFESGQTVTDFYAYGSPTKYSANTGLELSNESVFFLHRDPEGVLSFVMIHDAPGDGSGGNMKLEIKGLEDTDLMVQDDKAHQKDLYAHSQGMFAWVWYSCCTDGLAFEHLEEDACFTLSPRESSGISSSLPSPVEKT